MELLAMLSFGNFILFVVMGSYAYFSNKHSDFHKASAYINWSLAIWALGLAFFYLAKTEEMLWWWHKFSSIGWIGFPLVVIKFFIPKMQVNTHKEKNILSKYPWIFYLLPGVLWYNLWFNNKSPVTEGFIKTVEKPYWHYVNSYNNIFFWLFLLYMILYLGSWFILIILWGNKNKNPIVRQESKIIAIIDGVVLIASLVFDVFLPLWNKSIMPLSNLFIFFFLLRNFKTSYQNNLFSMEKGISSNVILETVIDPVILLDLDGYIYKCNKAVTELLCYTKEELIGMPLKLFLASGTYNEEQIKELFEQGMIENKDIGIVNKNGEIHHAIYSASMVNSSKYGYIGIVISLKDITLRKKTEEELRKSHEKYKIMANIDVLTQLPNRRFFFEKLGIYIENYWNRHSDFSLLFIDLNKFKRVNDDYGHDIGDELLIEVATRITLSSEKGDFLARIGGDEFVILTYLKKDKKEIQIQKKREIILKSCQGPIIIKNHSCDISASIGYSIFSQTLDVNKLIKEADDNMYRQKETQHFR